MPASEFDDEYVLVNAGDKNGSAAAAVNVPPEASAAVTSQSASSQSAASQTFEAAKTENASQTVADDGKSDIDQLTRLLVVALSRIEDLDGELKKQRDDAQRRIMILEDTVKRLRITTESHNRTLQQHEHSLDTVYSTGVSLSRETHDELMELKNTVMEDRQFLGQEVGQLRGRVGAIEIQIDRSGREFGKIKEAVDHVAGRALRAVAERSTNGDASRRIEAVEKCLGRVAARVNGLGKEVDDAISLVGLGIRLNARGSHACKVSSLSGDNI